jgi:hypothetical protein
VNGAGLAVILSIMLGTAVNRIAVDEPVPITVEVRNVSPLPIWVVGVVDGAESGARFPRWTPVVEGPGGRLPPAETPDFTSPLRLADFRRLAPNESFDPRVPKDGAAYFPLATFAAVSRQPGRYSLALELDTMAPDERAWQGTLPDRRPVAAGEADLVRKRLADVPHVRVRSNTLIVTVEP